MTTEQITAVVGYLVAAIVGAIIHRFWPSGFPSPATPAPALPGSASAAHDRPLANLLMQLLAAIAGGQLSIPSPLVPAPGLPIAPGGVAPLGPTQGGTAASVILNVAGRSFVLPIDPSAFGLQPGTGTPAAPSTG